jgi:NADPH2:quinone reductase
MRAFGHHHAGDDDRASCTGGPMADGERTLIAARLRRHGEPLAIERLELPSPRPGEVLVELRYAGVNPVDRYLAEGRVAPDGPLPRTLGSEASGTANGRAVLVAGAGLGTARDGVWASAAVVPEQAVVELPAGVEQRAAAAMGVAGLTAYKCVRELARVGPADRVLVLGAAGGVGSMIVSLARALGAHVAGQTSKERKAGLIREQGAERVLVGDAASLADALGELEPTVVFDPLGGPFLAPVVQALAPRGRIVSFGTSAGAEARFNLQTLYRKGASLLGYGGLGLRPDERRAGLQATLEALARGELRVRIDSVLPLAGVNEALARLERREVQGKLLLDLRP